jgi:hypothetical protein
MKTLAAARATTRLSGVAAMLRNFGRFSGLARLSLVPSALSMLSGCLVEDPPAFVKPTRTTPRVELRLAEPALDQIIIVDRGDPIAFRIPVVSEDAGVPLKGYLFRDTSLVPIDGNSVPASTLDDTTRRLELAYRPMQDLDPSRVADFGCHRFMARVSHLDNFNTAQLDWGVPFNVADVAEVYWWVNVVNIAAGEDPSVLRNCPQKVSVSE